MSPEYSALKHAWEGVAIALDVVAFFLVTTDLYGERRLKELSERLQHRHERLKSLVLNADDAQIGRLTLILGAVCLHGAILFVLFRFRLTGPVHDYLEGLYQAKSFVSLFMFHILLVVSHLILSALIGFLLVVSVIRFISYLILIQRVEGSLLLAAPGCFVSQN